MNETQKKLKLQNPLQEGSEVIHELVFQPLKAKDLRKISTTPEMGDFLKLVSISTGVVPSQIDELCLEDAMRAIEVVSSFFPNSQETTLKE